jgi:hypothetical protein
LAPGSRYHGKVGADLVPDKFTDVLFNLVRSEICINQCIAALDVRADMGKTSFFEYFAKP